MLRSKVASKIVVLLGLLVVIPSASADEINATVSAGRRMIIGSFGSYSSGSCLAVEVPQGRIAKQPDHGRLELMEERRSMDAIGCGKVAGNVLAVYYTPAKGFRGVDEASVDFITYVFEESGQTRNRRLSFNITVK